MVCPNCGIKFADGPHFCPKCGAYAPAPPKSEAQPTTPPMDWYYSLISVILPLSVLQDFISAFRFLTMAVYGSEGEKLFYFLVPKIQTLDILTGVMLLGVAVFRIYTRFRLSRFRKNGPLCICLVYGINVVLRVIYSISSVILINDAPFCEPDITPYVISITIGIAMLVGNWVYFKKRAHLFNK